MLLSNEFKFKKKVEDTLVSSSWRRVGAEYGSVLAAAHFNGHTEISWRISPPSLETNFVPQCPFL